MKSSQWTILGLLFIAMQSFFIYQDRFWGVICRSYGSYNLSTPLTQNVLISCLNAEIYEPFIWLLLPLAIVFFVCGWIEGRGKNKK